MDLVNDLDIEQHRKATGANLEPFQKSAFFLWFTGHPGFKRVPQFITRNVLGTVLQDGFTDDQAVDYIEQQMEAAGYRVKRVPSNGKTIAAWEISFEA